MSGWMTSPPSRSSLAFHLSSSPLRNYLRSIRLFLFTPYSPLRQCLKLLSLYLTLTSPSLTRTGLPLTAPTPLPVSETVGGSPQWAEDSTGSQARKKKHASRPQTIVMTPPSFSLPPLPPTHPTPTQTGFFLATRQLSHALQTLPLLRCPIPHHRRSHDARRLYLIMLPQASQPNPPLIHPLNLPGP